MADRVMRSGTRSSVWQAASRLGPATALAALILILNAANVLGHTPLSPVDELGHIDYLVHGAVPQVPRSDDLLTKEAMREAACLGADAGPLPPCDADSFSPRDFAWEGYGPANNHSPWYYIFTGMAARILRSLTGTELLTTWGRALGAAWLFSGCWLILLIAGPIAGSRWRGLVALLPVIAAPSVVQATTRVNPDATAVVAGALVLLAAVRWDEGRVGWWAPVGAAALAAAWDPTNLVGVGVAMAYLAIRSWQRREDDAGRGRATGWVVVASTFTAALTTISWLVIARRLGPVPSGSSPQDVAHRVDSLPLARVLGPSSIFALLPPISGYMPPRLLTWPLETFISSTVYLTITAIVHHAVAGARTVAGSAIGLSTLAVLVAGGPALVLQNYAQLHWYFPIAPRYGLSAMAGVGVCLSGLCSRRAGVILVGAVGGGLYLASVLRFV